MPSCESAKQKSFPDRRLFRSASITSGRSSPRFRGTQEASRVLPHAARRDRGAGPIAQRPRSAHAGRPEVNGGALPPGNGRVPRTGPASASSGRCSYDEGAVVVASTYTKVGGLVRRRGFRHDPDQPARDAGRVLPGLLHQPQPARRASTCSRATSDEYEADGFLINSIKSCNSFSAGQLHDAPRGRGAAHRRSGRVHRERPGRPALLLGSANIKNRLESYFQMLDQKRSSGVAAMKYEVYVGIDLGSTTTKAVILGRGRRSCPGTRDHEQHAATTTSPARWRGARRSSDARFSLIGTPKLGTTAGKPDD